MKTNQTIIIDLRQYPPVINKPQMLYLILKIYLKNYPSHRRQYVSIVAPLRVGLAMVVAGFSLGRGHLGQLRAVGLVMGVGRRRVVVLRVVVVVGVGLLLLAGLLVLPLFLLLLVLLLLFQLLLPLADPHELDSALLPTQNHWGRENKSRGKFKARHM